MSENNVITLTCLCRTISLPLTVPSSSFPLPVHLCHCDNCRHIFGTLACFHAFLLNVPFPPEGYSTDAFTKFQSSDYATKYFCSRCGSHILDHVPEDNLICASTGVMDNIGGKLEFNEHIFLKSTGDGGFADWLPSVAGKELTRWSGFQKRSEHTPKGWKDSTVPAIEVVEKEEKLHAHCYCKGVEFWISRPDKKKTEATIARGASSGENSDDSWWIARNPRSWVAENCACESCARSCGSDIAQFAFIPSYALTLADSQPFTVPFGTMKVYQSSKGRQRAFCTRCGAKIFYLNEDRPELYDIYVGLLAGKGAKAEGWLEWTNIVFCSDDPFNQSVSEALKDGLATWHKQKNAIEDA